MSTIPVHDIDPLVLKNVELIFGADPDQEDFRKAVDQVIFQPSSSQVSWTGLGLNTHTDQTTSTWVLTAQYAQDWDTPTSLSRYLYEHEGEEVPVVLRPKAGGVGFGTTVVIAPGAIGGNVNAFATTSVSLGCKTKPELLPAVPAG